MVFSVTMNSIPRAVGCGVGVTGMKGLMKFVYGDGIYGLNEL